MKYAILTAAIHVAHITAQTIISNPEVYISSCDALGCSDPDSGTAQLCSSDGYGQGIGIAPLVVPIPGSNGNLSFSLVDSEPEGVFAAPYRYQFITQKLYVGVSPDVDLRDQQSGCALMFQYQAQTFPFLTATASPNTTQCGDALSSDDMEYLTKLINDFDFGGSSNTTSSESDLPRCTVLAQHLKYQMHEDLTFGGAYYQHLVTVVGGAFIGAEVNTTSDAQRYGSCQPMLPRNYQLYNVLDTQQILHPDGGYDAGMGGRNGTTPIMTVMFGSNGTATNVQFLCMQQLAPGNRELPKEQLNFNSAAQHGVAWNSLTVCVAGLALVVLMLL